MGSAAVTAGASSIASSGLVGSTARDVEALYTHSSQATTHLRAAKAVLLRATEPATQRGPLSATVWRPGAVRSAVRELRGAAVEARELLEKLIKLTPQEVEAAAAKARAEAARARECAAKAEAEEAALAAALLAAPEADGAAGGAGATASLPPPAAWSERSSACYALLLGFPVGKLTRTYAPLLDDAAALLEAAEAAGVLAPQQQHAARLLPSLLHKAGMRGVALFKVLQRLRMDSAEHAAAGAKCAAEAAGQLEARLVDLDAALACLREGVAALPEAVAGLQLSYGAAALDTKGGGGDDDDAAPQLTLFYEDESDYGEDAALVTSPRPTPGTPAPAAALQSASGMLASGLVSAASLSQSLLFIVSDLRRYARLLQPAVPALLPPYRALGALGELGGPAEGLRPFTAALIAGANHVLEGAFADAGRAFDRAAELGAPIVKARDASLDAMARALQDAHVQALLVPVGLDAARLCTLLQQLRELLELVPADLADAQLLLPFAEKMKPDVAALKADLAAILCDIGGLSEGREALFLQLSDAGGSAPHNGEHAEVLLATALSEKLHLLGSAAGSAAKALGGLHKLDAAVSGKLEELVEAGKLPNAVPAALRALQPTGLARLALSLAYSAESLAQLARERTPAAARAMPALLALWRQLQAAHATLGSEKTGLPAYAAALLRCKEKATAEQRDTAGVRAALHHAEELAAPIPEQLASLERALLAAAENKDVICAVAPFDVGAAVQALLSYLKMTEAALALTPALAEKIVESVAEEGGGGLGMSGALVVAGAVLQGGWLLAIASIMCELRLSGPRLHVSEVPLAGPYAVMGGLALGAGLVVHALMCSLVMGGAAPLAWRAVAGLAAGTGMVRWGSFFYVCFFCASSKGPATQATRIHTLSPPICRDGGLDALWRGSAAGARLAQACAWRCWGWR